MEKDWEAYSGDLSDTEVDLSDSKDEELYYSSISLPKLQFRYNVSKARWNSEIGMAHVFQQKGKMWISTGIIRAGMTYCSLEETLYLVEIGALILMDDKDACLPLKDVYSKIAEEKSGCCWEAFIAYRHLKSLGYIIGRHGVPWSVKDVSSNYSSVSFQGIPGDGKMIDTELEDTNSVVEKLANLHFNELRPVFDIYLPNSKFRKSSPGDPTFFVVLCRGYPPSRVKLETLERQCFGIPLKFCHIDHGHASFFSFEKVELPLLP